MNPVTDYDHMFPQPQWKKYNDFSEFEKDFLKFHNISNWLWKQQKTLTLCYHTGIAPLIKSGNWSIPDSSFDAWKLPVDRKSIVIVYNKGHTIGFAEPNYFVLNDGLLYKTYGWSTYKDKMTITNVQSPDM